MSGDAVRTAFSRVVVAAAAFCAGGSCTLIDFSLPVVEESTDELCSDGRDNDFDGLRDCQDWHCLDRAPCCDIPQVLIADDFEDGAADCDDAACTAATCAELTCGPADDTWHTWPCPFPRVCEGSLHIDKDECFASGVLSKQTIALTTGLLATAVVRDPPERLGYFEMALTAQPESDLPGSLDPCGSLQRVRGFAAIRQQWSEQGYELVAQFQERDLGTSPAVTDPAAPHTLGIGIDADRFVVYTLDGQLFATSDIAVPDTDDQVHLALTGITSTVKVDEVRVQAGIRCHDPTTWDLVGEILAGDETGGADSYDRDEVYHPAVHVTPDGDTDLYYTGCTWGSNEDCDPNRIGICRAEAGGAGGMQRDPNNPLLIPQQIMGAGISGFRREMSIDLLPAEPLHGFVAATQGTAIYTLDAELRAVDNVLATGSPGDWDGGELCCASAVERPDGTTYLWYAGRATRESSRWAIGLAISNDGVSFERIGDAPVFAPGPADSFDAEAVTAPVVTYDEAHGLFRMWYEGHNFLGKTGLGYAVSTDGIEWHAYPGNPILVPDELALAQIGGPEVRLESDGRLRMWLHANTGSNSKLRIFELRNDGAGL